MPPRILILGAGAVGGYFGAKLTRAGQDVTLVDPWPEHVAAMRAEGLTIRAMEPEDCHTTPVRALHLSDLATLLREPAFDIGFLAVKSYDTPWATAMMLPLLAPQAPIVSLQNGINEDAIAAVAGWGRVIGCAIGLLAAELLGPALVQRNSRRGTATAIGMRVGEVHGRVTPRATAIAALLEAADSARVTTNIWGERWSKLTINAMRNPVSAMTGLAGPARDADEAARSLSIRLGSQCVRVGRALGLSLESISGLDIDLLARAESEPEAMAAITRQILAHNNSRSADQRPSMGQDVRKGRRTETEAISGLVARRGAEVGVDAGLHARVHDIMLRIERGDLTPHPSLVQGL
ncbi:ketopantoate reductase family protein [Falsiroseomonas selenitidurans]|uniref:2-dehydropantoate 2-reductase n=1 Tax=Falsiroseomonas selenitidurans TaxID=2716335 RepID=A0ABX1EAY2_9PROT|nr:2-dehydropantoate 2-reductase [Falsiroseomonas selenitidurans]NKC34399.1 2-dehydropantoate 2-reductase [Falsiroseomonas selenitidurans]